MNGQQCCELLQVRATDGVFILMMSTWCSVHRYTGRPEIGFRSEMNESGHDGLSATPFQYCSSALLIDIEQCPLLPCSIVCLESTAAPSMALPSPVTLCATSFSARSCACSVNNRRCTIHIPRRWGMNVRLCRINDCHMSIVSEA